MQLRHNPIRALHGELLEGGSKRADHFALQCWMFDETLKHGENLRRLAVTHALGIWNRFGPAAVEAAQQAMKTAALIHPLRAAGDWQAFLTDAQQRTLLFLDTMVARGDQAKDLQEAGNPPVLTFAYESAIDGRTLPRPVNYSLLRILPPDGVAIDPAKRPFILVDPRAGHGAGIGGFKPDSQVGEAFADGHSVYFCVFSKEPVAGQTLADICDAEAFFVEQVTKWHPGAKKPAIIGNCQGGWATMLVAASAPDAVGAVAINGAPLSYWAGESGKNPMRYQGGLQGGIVPALLTSDIGGGVFDGAWLVYNFERLNPAETWWGKFWNLYEKGDKERKRFLDFERWWSAFYFMNDEEIRWIVENLFIGNRLAKGQATLGGRNLDLRDIKAPIIVFASEGDNITPPQQALNWIPDLYPTTYEIKVRGQRIAYMVHNSIGHLGIFVSSKVATREHDAITDIIAAVEALPPGLYEIILADGPDRLHIKLEPRTIEDILAMDDGREDEQMFATVDALSRLAGQTYEVFARPIVRAAVTPEITEVARALQPNRMLRSIFSSENPAAPFIQNAAAAVRADRKEVDETNPFFRLHKLWADNVERGWQLYTAARDAWGELAFHATYGQPAMRLIGEDDLYRKEKQVVEDPRVRPEIQAALAAIREGGREAGAIRILMLLIQARGEIRRSRLERVLHELETRAIWTSATEEARARAIGRQQMIVEFDPEGAILALPDLLRDESDVHAVLSAVEQVVPRSDMTLPQRDMWDRIEAVLTRHLVNVRPARAASGAPAPATPAPTPTAALTDHSGKANATVEAIA